MTKTDFIVGFNLTCSKLQAIEIAISDNQIELFNINEVYLNEEINFEKDKNSKIGALIHSAYQELQINSPLNPKFISFCLPTKIFSIAQLPFDKRLSYQELLLDFKIQFSLLFPFRDDDLIIKFYEVEPNILQKYNSAIVIGIEKKYIDLIDNFAQNNKLKLVYIDMPDTSANLSILSSNGILCKGYYLSIYIQKNIFSYSFSFNQKTLKFKTFDYNRIGDIPDILNSELNQSIFPFINIDNLTAVFISGDEISTNLVSLLRKSLNFDLIYFNPFEKIKLNSNLYDNKFYLKKYNSFASALGIALRLN